MNASAHFKAISIASAVYVTQLDDSETMSPHAEIRSMTGKNEKASFFEFFLSLLVLSRYLYLFFK
ncbi:MAG: hypothetical protein DRR08_03095 [Candidatus Parabeggiatoa sp. nov. 2]|nr:MAG: hypothetical protein B6247_09155 [Beggiatoa sp. 4572_84]RKZ63571.1 MAG: hypothetical protein DRR08_03095 [Gammaproteobacteria bacterium]